MAHAQGGGFVGQTGRAGKLKATSLNAIGLAAFGFGAITTLFSGDYSLTGWSKVAIGAFVCYLFHEGAKLILAGLED